MMTDTNNKKMIDETIALQIKDLIIQKLDSDKAESINVIDLAGKSDIARYMVFASGLSMRHVKSLAENLVQELKLHINTGINIEGMESGKWILIDAYCVIVHIFQPEARLDYNVEGLWRGEK